MTTNLLSVIEQQHKALHALHYDIGTINQQHGIAEAALAAGQQALEQTHLDSERQERDIAHAHALFSNLKLQGEHSALRAAFGSLWPSAFSHGFQCAKNVYTHPQATEPEPIGFNGLTQAETEATMSVRGLSEPAPSTAGERMCGFGHESCDCRTYCKHPAQPAQGERAEAASGLRYEWKYYAENEGANGGSLARAIDRAAALLSAPALPVGELTDEQILDKKRIEQCVAVLVNVATFGSNSKYEDGAPTPNRLLQLDCAKYLHGLVSTEDFESANKFLLGQFEAMPADARTQPVREPLTDEELDLICEKALFCRISFQQFARSIETSHGIK